MLLAQRLGNQYVVSSAGRRSFCSDRHFCVPIYIPTCVRYLVYRNINSTKLLLAMYGVMPCVLRVAVELVHAVIPPWFNEVFVSCATINCGLGFSRG